MRHSARSMLPAMLCCLVFGSGFASAADQRTRIVESSLEDLSLRNDAALPSIRDTPQPGSDPFSGKRVDLNQKPAPTSTERVAQDIQSSLHRLRRETVSRQTADNRQARVNESQDRAVP